MASTSATLVQLLAREADQPPGELQPADAANADSRGQLDGQDAAVIGSGRVESEPWFAKLPPNLRSAIQSKSRGKPPLISAFPRCAREMAMTNL